MSHAFKRLLWKEYRAQWNLWISLLIGAALLDGLVLMLFLGQNHPEAMLWGFLHGPAFTLTICFAVASAALLFAGEEEEGTAGLLRQLPVSTAALFGSKLIWMVLATLLFGLFSLGIASICAASVGARPEFDSGSSLIGGVLQAVLAGWVTGVFWSLLLRKVMPVLLLSAGSMLLLIGLMQNLLVGYEALLMVLGSCSVIVLSIWPARCWIKGRALLTLPTWLAAPLPVISTTAAEQGDASGPFPAFVSFGSGLTSPQKILATLKSALLSPQQLTFPKLLRRSATRDTAFSRMVSMLVWRELRAAVPHVLLWSGIGAGAIILATRYSAFPWVWFVLFPLIVESGLKSYRGEHANSAGLFFAHRGISPGWIWGTKTFVWGTALIVLTGSLLLLDFMTVDLRQRSDLGARIPSVVQVVSQSGNHVFQGAYPPQRLVYPGLSVAEDTSIRASACLSLLFALFGVGQLCSYWCRSSLMAWGLALVASSGVYAIGVVLVLADVPHLWTLWPFVLCLFLAAWSTRRSWQEQRTSWGLTVRKCGWILVPGLCVGLIAWVSRAVAVTPQGIQQLWRMEAALDQGYGQPSLSFHAMDLQRTGPQEWNQAWSDYGLFVRSVLRPGTGSNVNLSAENLSRGFKLIERINVLNESFHGTTEYSSMQFGQNIPIEERVHWDGALAVGFVDILISVGNERLAKGDSDGALDAYLNCVQLERYLAGQAVSWGNWTLAATYEQVGLNAISAWAADPAVTIAQLDRAETTLAEFGNTGPMPGKMLFTRYVLYDQAYQCRGPLWENAEFQSEMNDLLGNTRQTVVVASLTERERCRRLLGILTLLEGQMSLAPHDRPIDDQLARNLRRWLSTTVLLPPELAHSPALEQTGADPSPVIGTYLDTLSRERATRTQLRLQKFQREHGAFPSHLALLEVPELLPIDPWTSTYFGYIADGFPAAMQLDAKLNVPAKQPLLWSHGPHGYRGIPTPVTTAGKGSKNMKWNPSRVIFVPLGRQSGSIDFEYEIDVETEPQSGELAR